MTIPTPEAIEAIAVAMFYQQVGLKPPYPLWDGADTVEKDNCRNDAQLAYDAMAPFIAAQAKADAWDEGYDDCWDFHQSAGQIGRDTNPYRAATIEGKSA